jgi:hypothetical protein
MIALDESCSMTSSDFDKQKQFAAALANATEAAFNVTRFAGAVFGFHLNSYATPINTPAASIFQHMQPSASTFAASLAALPAFNCGGTPTDEALADFYTELSQTQVPGRMQMAVLSTDGIPTMCYTTTKTCSGTNQSYDTTPAANAAIAQRFDPTKLPSLGSLMMTVGIGSDLTSTVSTTQFGTINGETLLIDFASSPRLALLATNFATLISVTLAQVVDSLCYYVMSVVQPLQGTCYTSGTMFVIKGYNMFAMGQPKCRWQQVGTQNFLYTNATITITNETVGIEPGIVGLVTCPAPAVTVDVYNAYLEVSRDGNYYTNNQYSVLIRSNCSAPVTEICPNSTIAAVFSACTAADFQDNGHCSSNCSQASDALAASFQAQGIYPAFTQPQITSCIINYPSSLSAAVKSAIAMKTAPGKSPCTAALVTSPAEVATSSFLCLVALLSVALS